MALKKYKWRGYTWQFEETEAPEDAVFVKDAPKPNDKSAKAPATKTRTPRTKKAE